MGWEVAMFKGFAAIAYKEILHVMRDPATRFVFVIPVVQLLLFGYAINLEVTDISTAIVDHDQTEESRELVALYSNTRTFDIRQVGASLEELEQSIIAGHIKVGIFVPEGFARHIQRGEEAQVLVLVDGSYSSEATAALNVSQAMGLYLSRNIRAGTANARELMNIPPGMPLANVNQRPVFLQSQSAQRQPLVPGSLGSCWSRCCSAVSIVGAGRRAPSSS
jgi:ABC-2 type transport system permease protein